MIAFDLVAVSPMSSMYGNVAYIEYVKGTTKGESTQGDMTNSVWELGKVDVNYTGSAVVEGNETGTFAPAFPPVAQGFYVKDGEVVPTTVTGGTWYQYKNIAADGTATYSNTADTAGTGKKVAYFYDNVIIPQEDANGKSLLPTLKAELKNIGLEAHARRIAVFYSQMAAFQAKTDYGFDLADGLAEQAVGQLAYEIDTEIVDMLHDAAAPEASIADFSKTLGVGVSLADWYAGFAAKLEEYKMALYSRTKKFTPNFMVCAPDVMPILQFVPGFQAASVGDVNGPYFAGTVSGLKVYVTPNIDAGEFFLGVNQGAMQASAGVYAPYLPVVPTQLLGFADGGMSQGWSTLYDAKILNADLLISGKITA